LMLNIIFKNHSNYANYSLPSRNTDIACGRLRLSGFFGLCEILAVYFYTSLGFGTFVLFNLHIPER
jgi:hypothetical protein